MAKVCNKLSANPQSSMTTDFSVILRHQAEGNTRPYDILLENLTSAKIPSGTLTLLLRSFRGNVGALGHHHEQLINKLLKLNWPSETDGVVSEYRMFLLNLLSAHTFYLRPALQMLVKLILPDPKVTDPDEETRISDKKKFMNVHHILQAVVKLIPMTWSVLMPLLSSSFPYILKPLYHVECYVKNLLRIVTYVPKLRQPILELVVGRLVQIDVRCPRVDIQDAEDNDDDDNQFNMDLGEENEGKTPMRHVDAHKLDVLMEMLLEHIHKNAYNKKGELDWDACKQLYRELLLVFEKIVLPTYASSHVQFFIFYICSFKQNLSDGFIDYLWKKFQCPNTQTEFRQAAVGYIGSFISRAKYINIGTVKTCLNLIVNWIHRYLEELSAETVFTDLAHHAPFNAACQTVFYVFCFRNKDIFTSKKGYKWAESLNLQKIVTSRLNPLRFCLPIVVKTFSSLTRSHQLAFCDTIVERNKRYTLKMAGVDGIAAAAAQSVLSESFFPFDPFILRRSSSYIHPVYKDYDGNNDAEPFQDEMEEDADDDFLPGLRTDSMDTTSTSWKYDLLQYSTSPGFKHL